MSFSSMLVTAIGDCLVNSGKFSESDCEAIQGALQFSCPENPGIHQVSKLVQSKKKGFSDESSNLWGLQGKFVKSLLHRDEFAEVSLPYLESVIGKVKENGERGRQRARENEFLKLNIVLYTMGTWLKDSIGSIRKELEHDFQKPELTKAELAKNVQAFCKTIREAKSANYDLKWPRLVVEGHRNGDFQKKDWFLDLFDLAVRCAPIKFEKQNLEMEFLKKRAKAIARTNIIRDKKSFYSLRRFIEEEMYKGQYLSLSTTIYSPLQYLFEKKYSSNTKWTRQQINERVSKLEELMQLYKRYYDVMVVMKSVEDIGAYEITEATKKLSNQIYWTIKQQATGSLVCETDMQTFMTFIKSFGGRYSETDSVNQQPCFRKLFSDRKLRLIFSA